MKSVCVILVLGFVAFANAKPSGETAGTSEYPDVPALINKAHEGIEKLKKDLQTSLGTDPDTVFNNIKSQSAKLADNVQEYIANVTKDIQNKSPEFEAAFADIKTKLTKVVEDINARIPNAQEQAATLQEKLATGLNTIVDESNKVYKTFNENTGTVREDIAKITKQAVEIAIQATQNLDAKVKALATPAPAA